MFYYVQVYSKVEQFCMHAKPFDPWVGKIPWRMEKLHTPVFLPGEFHGQWSLPGYIPWGCKVSDMTERLSLHFI